MNDLRHCPFCGGYAMMWQSAVTSYWFLKCKSCLVQMMCEDKEVLIKNWNKRYEPRMPNGAYVPTGNARLRK